MVDLRKPGTIHPLRRTSAADLLGQAKIAARVEAAEALNFASAAALEMQRLTAIESLPAGVRDEFRRLGSEIQSTVQRCNSILERNH